MLRIVNILELAEKLKFFSQAQGNGFKRGCVLSRTRPRFHTPKVGFEKVRKIVIFRLFPHPLYFILNVMFATAVTFLSIVEESFIPILLTSVESTGVI